MTPTLAGRRVLVTGSRGSLGSVTTAHLTALGAVVVGASAPEVDTTQAAAVREVMAGAELVVHLAAIPSPDHAPWPEVFANNVVSTFNVLWAAAEHGIQRVMIASSINATGLPRHAHGSLPAYFPFDEDLPHDVTDAYSLSKQTDELTARMAHRRWGMDVVAVRFPITAASDHLLRHSERLTRDPAGAVREGWTYLDVRDAARVAELALTRPLAGAVIVFVSADETAVPFPTEALLDAYAPEVPRRRRISGREVPADLTRARTLLGFTAAHPLEIEPRPFDRH